MDDIVVSNEGVTKLLKGFNPSKALGPDELYPRVLKALATELAPVFSSSEPSGSQGELKVYPYSGVRCRCRRRRRQQCLNIFFSETALPIKAKFYVEPPWEGGTKVYINGTGHMTKMAAKPIYGKSL